jgi:Uma2 family endonuclease
MTGESAARKLKYTWADYRTWNDGQRWEIVDGNAYAMSPAPSPRHQGIVVELARQMADRLEGRPCRVFVAPIDVKLSESDVVQPDVVVVCEKERIKPTHIEGPPTLAIEVLSPSTAVFDHGRKLALYAAAGVREVWLVTPYPWLVEVLVLDGDGYRLAATHSKGERLRSRALTEIIVDLGKVFDFPLDPGEAVEMVKEGRPPYGG